MTGAGEFWQRVSRLDERSQAAMMLLLWDLSGSVGPVPIWAHTGRGRLIEAARAASAAGASDMAATFQRVAQAI